MTFPKVKECVTPSGGLKQHFSYLYGTKICFYLAISTPFSDFFRNAKSAEKRQFFDKVAREAIKEQQEMIALARKHTLSEK